MCVCVCVCVRACVLAEVCFDCVLGLNFNGLSGVIFDWTGGIQPGPHEAVAFRERRGRLVPAQAHVEGPVHQHHRELKSPSFTIRIFIVPAQVYVEICPTVHSTKQNKQQTNTVTRQERLKAHQTR